ncbi:hypothetical protein K9L97_02495 [Candidatus Woesearchaeota archaeon]|nr:hypothetical protein [Candidatus Woesearchaeota archaeon]
MVRKIKNSIFAFLFLLVLVMNAFSVAAVIQERNIFDINCDEDFFPNTYLGKICKSYFEAGDNIFEFYPDGKTARIITTDYFFNMITNPGFEVTDGNAAHFWSPYNDVSSFEISSSEALSGEYSLKFARSSPSSSYAGIETMPMYLDAGQEYVLKAFFKGSVSGNARFSLHCVAGGNNFAYSVVEENRVMSGDLNSWTEKSLVFIPDADAEYCKPLVYFNPDSSGELYVDNVRLGWNNLSHINMKNTFVVDFTYDINGLLTRVVDPNSNVISYTSDSLFQVSDLSVNNFILNSNFDEYIDSAKAMYWYLEGAASIDRSSDPFVVMPVDSAISQFDIPVRSGTYYDLSLNAKGNLLLELEWQDFYRNRLSADYENLISANLQDYSFEISPPKGARFLKISLFANDVSDVYFVSMLKKDGLNYSLSAEYTDNGKIKSIDYGLVYSEFEYNINNLLSKSITKKKADLSVLFDERYDYDSTGNLIGINAPDIGSATFSYDYLHRLKDVNKNGLFFPNLTDFFSFEYDYMGNILSNKGQDYQYYEGTDRLKDDGLYTYEYNSKGQITRKISKATGFSVDYYYNEKGLFDKVVNKIEDTSVDYYYSGSFMQRKIVNYPDYSEITIYIYYNGDLLYSYKDEFSYDATGSCTINNWNPSGRHFVIKGSSGSVVGIADDRGNMKLAGSITESGDASSSSGRSFKIKGDSGVVAAFDASGNLILNGVLNYYQDVVSPTSGRDFVIKGSDGPVLMITSNGDLFAKGCVSGGEVI